MDQQREGWAGGWMDEWMNGELDIWLVICLRLPENHDLPRGLSIVI